MRRVEIPDERPGRQHAILWHLRQAGVNCEAEGYGLWLGRYAPPEEGPLEGEGRLVIYQPECPYEEAMLTWWGAALGLLRLVVEPGATAYRGVL